MSPIVYGATIFAAFIASSCAGYYSATGKLEGVGDAMPGIAFRGAALAVVSALLIGGIDGRIQCSFTGTSALTEDAK